MRHRLPTRFVVLTSVFMLEAMTLWVFSHITPGGISIPIAQTSLNVSSSYGTVLVMWIDHSRSPGLIMTALPPDPTRSFSIPGLRFDSYEGITHWNLIVWGHISWWLIALLLSLLPATRLLKFHGARRRSHGLCPQCGYDLRATSDRCPECGTSRGMKRA